MRIYIVNELTRLMENEIAIYNTVEGVYTDKEKAIAKYNEVSTQAADDLNGGEVESSGDHIIITRGNDIIEVRIEEQELEMPKTDNYGEFLENEADYRINNNIERCEITGAEDLTDEEYEAVKLEAIGICKGKYDNSEVLDGDYMCDLARESIEEAIASLKEAKDKQQ